MLEHGCDPNEAAWSSNITGPGGPVLLDAARHGYEAICNLLLERGADLDRWDDRGHSPLYAAAKGGHSHLVRLLLGWRADPNRATPDGVTPLMAAAKANAVQSIRALLAAGAPIEARDRHGNTALMHADRSGAVDILLESGASEYAQNSVGKTALALAVEDTLGTSHPFFVTEDGKHKGDKDLGIPAIQALLSRGRALDIQDDDGNTPLIIAAEGGRADVVQMLLEHGAQRSIQNRQGLTALDAAATNGHDDTVRLLESTGN